MFLKSDSVLRCSASLDWVRASRVPQHHRYYQSTKTSCAEYRVAYLFASPLQPILSASLPCGGELRSGLVPFKPGTTGYTRLVNHRISQVPGESVPYLCPALRSRPVHRPSPSRRRRCGPHFADNEETGTTDFSRLNHAASVPAAYASSDALPHPHARLASGRWLALAGCEKFLSSTSDFLLSQIYPGATAKVPQASDDALLKNARESGGVREYRGAQRRHNENQAPVEYRGFMGRSPLS